MLIFSFEFFHFLVKKLQVLAEEIIAFLKLAINLDFFYNHPKIFESMTNKVIEVTIIGTNQFFLLSRSKTNLTSININSFVEFYGRIRKMSCLKAINTKINFVCSNCGVIYSRNIEHVRNHKSLNNYFMNNQDRNFHCKNSESAADNVDHKVNKEYSDMKVVRFFQVDVEFKYNNTNNFSVANRHKNSLYSSETDSFRLLCFTIEENFIELELGALLKFSAVVKAKPEDLNQYENTYEKIMEIYQIESESGIINRSNYAKKDFEVLQPKENSNNNTDNNNNNKREGLNSFISNNKKLSFLQHSKSKNPNMQNSNLINIQTRNAEAKHSLVNFQQDFIATNFFFAKYGFSASDLTKIQRLSGYKTLSSFVMLNILDNKSYANFEFINVLLYYFAFSKGAELSINIFDLTKTENISNQLKSVYCLLSNLEANFFAFNNDNKSNEDFLAAKDKASNRPKGAARSEAANFEINFGEIFSKKNDFIFLDQIPLNVHNNLQCFLSYGKILKNFNAQINLSVSDNSQSHSAGFAGLGSVVSNTKITNMGFKSQDLLNSCLFQMVNFYDVNFFYTDRLDAEKDRKKTNQILKEQFENLNNQINSNNSNINSNNNNINKLRNSNANNFKNMPSNRKTNMASNNFSFKNKRKFSEFSQANVACPNNNNNNLNFNACEENNNFNNLNNYYGIEIGSAEEFLALEDLNYFGFLKGKIKQDLGVIYNDAFLSEIMNLSFEESSPFAAASDKNNNNYNNKKNNLAVNNINSNYNNKNPNSFFTSNAAEAENSIKTFFTKYLIFVNTFINPKIEADVYTEIFYLAKSLEEIFYPIKACEFLEFPEIEKLLVKFCFINARIDMRERVLLQDVFEAFLFVKEYLSICLTFSLANRKEMVNKNKKTKINFVMEIIKQLCESERRKSFTKSELKGFCDEINMIDDLDNIIETLNFNGFMIKLNSSEYQLA